METYDVVFRWPDLPTPQVALSGIADEAEAHRRGLVLAGAWEPGDGPTISIEPSRVLVKNP